MNRAAAFLLLSVFLRAQAEQEGASTVANLAVMVTGSSREFAYTNKIEAFFYGETHNAHTRSAWQGFNVANHEFLNDYQLLVDGRPLVRSTALRCVVRPDYLIREYPDGITEELRLADSVALFAVHISAPRPVEVGFIPFFSDIRDTGEVILEYEPGGVNLASRKHLRRTPQENYPAWVGIRGGGFLPDRRTTRVRGSFSPFALYSGKARKHIVACAVADTRDGARLLASSYERLSERYASERTGRLAALLSRMQMRSADSRLNDAIAWAALSLDALIMHQGAKGILAGLPWFNNYWGRDTFIAFPGAALVTGRFAEAREILRTFAAFQQIDTTSPDYGRIPNLVTATDRAYNTADGTPRFVQMVREYVERSGDEHFLLEIYPTVLRSIVGTLRSHTDSLGFLTHGDAETWMDAVGPEGPWSPRGNRANDIQALWAGQLEAGIWCATRLGDASSAVAWERVRRRLRHNFQAHFIDNGTIADHLQPDGTRSSELRPNQVFTAPLLSPAQRAGMLQTVVNRLTYPYGVASLSQDEPNFHPYHQFAPYYPKDAAYHNGTVWTWLQGPVVTELCRAGRQDLALVLMRNSAHQILDRGAVGTQSELLDALPRPGEKEPRLSGTFSQAWNLAEFVRNWYDDILGFRVNHLERVISFRPRIPQALMPVVSTVGMAHGAAQLEARQHGSTQAFTLRGPAIHGYRMNVEFVDSSGRAVRASLRIPDVTSVALRWDGKTIAARGDGRSIPVKTERESMPTAARLAFATPTLHPGLRALKGPGYPLISHAEVRKSNPAAQVLVDAEDPPGDDRGTGSYTYPRNANFVAGCFDIRRLTITFDSAYVYFALRFSALSDPGWHPEYGFQLTYAVIAIDQDGIPGSGRADIGHNAKYRLVPVDAYERMLVIGGGVAVENRQGETVAAYLPVEADAVDPLGDVMEAAVRFAIPLRYLGEPPTAAWKFTVLTGGQDDHGGAGIGEFREVHEQTGEWNGGGKLQSDGRNVYDVLAAGARK